MSKMQGRERNKEVNVGFSILRGEHRMRRGQCTREFDRVFMKMPLQYIFGKS